MFAVRNTDDIAGDMAPEALNRKRFTIRVFKSNDDVRWGAGRLYGLAR